METLINETVARLAKENKSWNSYKAGSATNEYNDEVERVQKIVEDKLKTVSEKQQQRVKKLFEVFKIRLARNVNKENEISARCPSVFIAGPSNFPVRKKEKQIKAWEKNHQDLDKVYRLIERIKAIGKGGIRSDSETAREEIEEKIKKRERSHEIMKGVNQYFRKNKTLDGCELVSEKILNKIKKDFEQAKAWKMNPMPFESWALSNNLAEIRRLKKRISQIEAVSNAEFKDIEFEGGSVEFDQDAVRVKVLFDEKPTREIINELKQNGFRWAPSIGAWQRLLNNNGVFAVKRLSFINR